MPTLGEALPLASTMPLARYKTALKIMVVSILSLFDLQEKDGRVLALGRSEYGRLGLGEGESIL